MNDEDYVAADSDARCCPYDVWRGRESPSSQQHEQTAAGVIAAFYCGT
jgi:hypothetical protein